LVGAGSLLTRTTIYQLVLNTLHALCNVAEDECDRPALIASLERFAGAEMQTIFGVRNEPGQASADGISLTALDVLVKELLLVMDAASLSEGTLPPH
jgi:hypothetical protein